MGENATSLWILWVFYLVYALLQLMSMMEWQDQIWELEPYEENLEKIVGDNSYGRIFKELVEEAYGYKVDITKKSSSEKGFTPQKGRWQVERSFGWLNFFRRLSREEMYL